MKWPSRANITFPNPDPSTKLTCTYVNGTVFQNATDCDDDDDDDEINFTAWLANKKALILSRVGTIVWVSFIENLFTLDLSLRWLRICSSDNNCNRAPSFE